MKEWSRAELEACVERIVQKVFGTAPGEIGHGDTFAGDLMAESLDYVDISVHVSHDLGIRFDFAEAAETIRAGRSGPIRVRDLLDHLESRLAGRLDPRKAQGAPDQDRAGPGKVLGEAS